MEQQERNGVSDARYAALELIEADLRDGNRIDAEVARHQLKTLVERGELELWRGEVRAYCGPGADPNVFGVSPDGEVVVPVNDDVLVNGVSLESGLWPAVEVEDPRAMVS